MSASAVLRRICEAGVVVRTDGADLYCRGDLPPAALPEIRLRKADLVATLPVGMWPYGCCGSCHQLGPLAPFDLCADCYWRSYDGMTGRSATE